jgi:hypothetical protein
MVDEVWLSVDLPILTALVEMESRQDPGLPNFDQNASTPGLSRRSSPEGQVRPATPSIRSRERLRYRPTRGSSED